MSGEQSTMKTEINAALNKLRSEQRERIERQARRRLLVVGLLMGALFALGIALGVALWGRP